MADKHIGLEINDKGIKYAELFKKGGIFSLGVYGEVRLPEGLIEEGSIKDGKKLKEMISAIQKKGKWGSVTVSHLPDQVFLADILKESGFKNIYFESTGEALARVAIANDSKETDMFVYFTGANMDICRGITSQAQMLSTSKFSSILLEKPRDREIILSFIKEKIDEQYISWHTHKDKENGQSRKRAKIEKIILAGR